MMTLPEDFVKRIAKQNYIDSASLISALGETSPVSIRINNRKWRGIPSDNDRVPWSSDGYYLPSRPSFTLDPLFHAGCYYPQEASSMFLEQFISQVHERDAKIRALDLCGAPGGKSLILSDILGDGALLVSNDVIRTRASILAENVTKWGAGNTIVTQSDPSAFGRMEGFFDLIVVDAPCSGEGMFRTEVAVNEWSPDNTLLCSERQKRILIDVWPALRSDGILVYSTCTFNPAENEENIKWLTQQSDAETIRIDISGYEGITEIDHDGIYGYGFHPGRIRGEGLFMAAVRKISGSRARHIAPVIKGEQRPGKTEIKTAGEWCHLPADRLLRKGNEIIAAPANPELLAHMGGFVKIVKTGTSVMTVMKNGFIPSHDLAMSVHAVDGSFPVYEATAAEALTYLGRGNLTLPSEPVGWILIKYKGATLGFVNNLGKRTNNCYPMEWRIRMTIPRELPDIVKWQ